MNLGELQAELRHFAAERNWQPFHTPKNLSTALMVEAAELAEIFQWQTPEESRRVVEDVAARQRVGEEVADVLMYLLQVADHCQIDIGQAVRDKLAKNVVKHPARRVIARVSPKRASVPGTHVLLDYENVQPSDAELRALVPDAAQVWVFHGPQQRGVEKRYASFGSQVTAVPISKSGKNALDFHLSFYMGYIASRNPSSTMVVVANDKGYEPMLEHAKALKFAVRRQPFREVKGPAKKAAVKKAAGQPLAAKEAPAKRASPQTVLAQKDAATKTAAKPAAVKQAAAKKVAAKTGSAKAAAPAPLAVPAKKAVSKLAAPAAKAKKLASAAGGLQRKDKPAVSAPDSPSSAKKLAEGLRNMGDKRPSKPASLRRWLKSHLGAGTTESAVELALSHLISSGALMVDPVKGVSYPRFEASAGTVGA